MSNSWGFVRHYGPALLWLLLPVLALGAFVLPFTNILPNSGIKAFLIILSIGIIAGGTIYRYSTTWHMRSIPASSMPIQTSGTTDLLGCLLTMLISIVLNLLISALVPIVIAVVTWPFLEVARQSRFLANAWKCWGTGQILVGPEGQLVRADTNLDYRPEGARDTIAFADTNSS